ncbi:uncharacterized protein F5Z01DRAFT_662859 [Emericellopsis atlantica]|uniref:Uncharacterized protein n=1 Tax=Emericellopsis atlantica TaxID=2614577 RepID=A0A9P7ZHR2_9HYPO|nr:uncharacterized protein F5Z01DRAFT_662859 [Emericellopsis atlantica]KAG9251765.1 hypothetical protein F5Z01DRAFT_662859 [Emericellopsis atlantica]
MSKVSSGDASLAAHRRKRLQATHHGSMTTARFALKDSSSHLDEPPTKRQRTSSLELGHAASRVIHCIPEDRCLFFNLSRLWFRSEHRNRVDPGIFPPGTDTITFKGRCRIQFLPDASRLAHEEPEVVVKRRCTFRCPKATNARRGLKIDLERPFAIHEEEFDGFGPVSKASAFPQGLLLRIRLETENAEIGNQLPNWVKVWSGQSVPYHCSPWYCVPSPADTKQCPPGTPQAHRHEEFVYQQDSRTSNLKWEWAWKPTYSLSGHGRNGQLPRTPSERSKASVQVLAERNDAPPTRSPCASLQLRTMPPHSTKSHASIEASSVASSRITKQHQSVVSLPRSSSSKTTTWSARTAASGQMRVQSTTHEETLIVGSKDDPIYVGDSESEDSDDTSSTSVDQDEHTEEPSQRVDPQNSDQVDLGDVISSASQQNVPSPKAPPRPAIRVRSPEDDIIVPNNGTVFYHPIGRRALKPGTVLPRPQPLKEMFRYKHMYWLREEPDITAAQVEYISAFDEVMDEHDINARTYFPTAWKDFVARKRGWISERQHRVDEFHKQKDFLLEVGLLQQEDIEGIEPMATARGKRSEEDPPPVRPQARSTRSGCGICHKPVAVFQAAYCTAKQHEGPNQFHKACALPPRMTIEQETTFFRDKRTYKCVACKV